MTRPSPGDAIESARAATRNQWAGLPMVFEATTEATSGSTIKLFSTSNSVNRKRDAGLSSAASHWCAESVARELRYLLDEKAVWTTDDLWDRFSPILKDAVMMSPNVIPAVVTDFAKQNVIVQTGHFVRTARPEGRKRRIAQWRKA